MPKTVLRSLRCLVPLIAICLPFALATAYTGNTFLKILGIAAAIFSLAVYLKGWHRIDFDPGSGTQKAVFAAAIIILIIMALFICAVSIESDWMFEYPLPGSVDNYGCYPQMFDAFQKGQLHIDTDYDLSVLDALENPYDTAARREATGERFGVIWDRAYYEGKLYSYFGIAPIIFLYFPAYWLTGMVLSDALAAAAMAGYACIFLMLIIWELCRRLGRKVPFMLVLLGGITVCFGALLWPTLTNANFYHLAVLSGICSVSAFFLLVLKAEARADGIARKILFALAGIAVAAIVASRPNMVLYVFIALPLLISVIKNKPYGNKSLALDIAAFSVPMIVLGGLIMLYNNARFGSPFDFGTNYQLTLTDTSTYSFSASLILPAFFHYFINPPEINDIFPYIHPAVRRLVNYSVDRLVYTSATVGSVFFPCTWGCFALPFVRNKRKLITAAIAVGSVIFIAIFNMCYAGVHLRYAADIMFVLSLVGVYLLISAIGKAKKGSAAYISLYTLIIVLFAATVIVTIPLGLDNERDMIFKYHREFYNLLKGV